MKTIEADAFRYSGESGRIGVLKAMSSSGFRFSLTLRQCAAATADGIRGLPRLAVVRPFYEHLRLKYGYDIPYVTLIGAGFHLAHFGGVVINMQTKIGACVSVSQGVTIGRVVGGRKQGTPTIGDRVWIGANAVIVGNCTVGSDSRIAPGAFVDFDVPQGGVVVGNPGRIVAIGGTGHSIERVPPGLFNASGSVTDELSELARGPAIVQRPSTLNE